ncbi:hypothetical protein [Hydrotalea sp.]|uniref:hypothetical protein n=1 Tax=Hydrotalea sp. TaxID=2881279 RepID=UPI002616D078|nr:hypothetical protein [Hydrotalea sp.]
MSMNILSVYRVLTIILLPFATLFGFESVLSVFAGIGNPTVLLSAVILACVVIYIFAAAFFLYKGILKNAPCKAGLKDWIKINSVITLIFSILAIISCISILYFFTNKEIYAKFLTVLNESRPTNIPNNISSTELMTAMRNAILIMLPFSIVLLVHILMTYRLMKKYAALFAK